MKYWYIGSIFASGFLLCVQLVWFQFGVPESYEGAWWKVVLAFVLLGWAGSKLEAKP